MSIQTPPVTRAEPDQRGLAAARAVAGYQIGDRSWADLLIDAYLNPEQALEALRRERDEARR